MTRRDDATTAMTVILGASTVSLMIGTARMHFHPVMIALTIIMAFTTLMTWCHRG